MTLRFSRLDAFILSSSNPLSFERLFRKNSEVCPFKPSSFDWHTLRIFSRFLRARRCIRCSANESLLLVWSASTPGGLHLCFRQTFQPPLFALRLQLWRHEAPFTVQRPLPERNQGKLSYWARLDRNRRWTFVGAELHLTCKGLNFTFGLG